MVELRMNFAAPDTPDSGVYMIRCTLNKQVYVGSSKQLKHRLQTHRSALRAGTHHSDYLQRAWAKHGERSFEFFVVGYYPPERLQEEEQHWLDTTACAYNMSRDAYRVSHTPEARAKMSAKAKAAMTPERRKAISDWVRQNPIPKKPLTAAAKERMRSVHRARCAQYSAFGKLWSLKDLAETYNVRYGMLKDRVAAGWDVEKAVLTPKRKGGL